MHDNVTSLNGNPIASQLKASTDCVNVLEEWLEMAKTGKVVSVAIVGVGPDPAVTMYGLSRHQENATLIIGALEHLKAELIKADAV